MESLREMRKQIDEIDRKILETLQERFEITGKVGDFKVKNSLPARDPQREVEMLEKRLAIGKNMHLESEFVRELFALITKTSRKRHLEKGCKE